MNDEDASVLPAGMRIDQYVIRGVLGRGGFGITYLVRDEALQKDFALKEFFPGDLVAREGVGIRFNTNPRSESDYRWGLKKFYDEARLLAQFNHANIVNVRRVFEANNSAYMLLDFINGSTLEKWLQGLDSPATQEELDLIAAPILSALELVHENRTWHLDISPENVMIRAADGAPILLDFGASRFEIKQHSQLVSALVFKSGYSAPEQYTSNVARFGPWTDIYAFGATLYRAIAGSRPAEATERQLHDDQLPAARIGKGRYRDTFLRAVDRAMRLAPKERPQSIAEWREDLLARSSRDIAPAMTRILTGRTTSVPKPGPQGPLSLGRRIAAAVAPARRFFVDRKPLPRPFLLVGAVVAASLLTGVATWLVTSGREPAPPPRQEESRVKIEPKQNRLSEAGEAWNAIKDTTSVAVLEAFIARYQDTFFADVARARIADLKKQQTPTPTPPPTPTPTPKAAPQPIVPTPNMEPERLRISKLGLLIAKAPGAAAPIVVVDVERDSDAQKKGIKANDQILEAGGHTTDNTKQVEAAVDEAVTLGRRALLLRIRSADQTRFVAVQIHQPTGPQKPEAARCDSVALAAGSELKCIKPGSGKADGFKDCNECPRMVVVPAGSTTMGSPADEAERSGGEDQRALKIAQPFAVGALAVTRGEFAAFVKTAGHKMDAGCFTRTGTAWTLQTDRSWQSPGFEQDDRHPVTCVSWHEAKAYVAWLVKATGKRYRLLSEAEREYVTRAGTSTAFWWGPSISTAQANYNGAYAYAGGSRGYFRDKTMSADSTVSNAWGLYNVHGNVWDWVEDCWNTGNAGNPGDGSARASGNCGYRGLRGGSWLNAPKSLRSAMRTALPPDIRHNDVGFRVARTLD